MRKNRLKKYAFIAVGIFFFLSFKLPASADTLHLKNGRSIEGLIKKEDAHNVGLEISFGSMKFSRDQIERIERSTPAQAELIRQEWEKERIKAQERAKAAEEIKERQPKQVNMDNKSGHIMVVTTLNKKVKANFILDTGASIILLSNKIAASLGIDTNSNAATTTELTLADGRKINAKMIILDSVSVEGVEAQKVEAAVLPPGDSNVIANDGLLGMSFLKKFNFKIDYKYGKLILEKL